VERQCASDIATLIVIVGRGRLDSFTTFLDRTSEHIRMLSARLLFDEALLLEDQIVAAIWKAVEPHADDPAPTAYLANEHERDRVIAAQRSVVLIMNAWLGLVDAAEMIAKWRLGADIDRIVADRDALYKLNLPRPVVETLEQLGQRITFENNVEGQQITPAWFVHHHVARFLAGCLLAGQKTITHRFSSRTIDEVRSAIEAKDRKLAAMVAFSALEMIDKIDTHHELIASAHQSVRRWQSPALDDPDWPVPLQSPPFHPELRKHVIGYIGQCLPSLPADPHDSRQPDLYGQAYVFLFNATFEAILEGDNGRAIDWFTILFSQNQAAAQRMTADVAGQLADLRFIYTVEPLVGMMELSGYAVLLEELNGEGIWDQIRTMWDNRRNQLGESFVQTLLDIMDHVDSMFSLNDLYVLRTSREQRLTRSLEERGITDPDHFFDPEKPRLTTELPPIVAAFAPGEFGITWKPTDLFLVHYVLPQLNDDHPVPARVRALAETIDHIREEQQSTPPDDPDDSTNPTDDTARDQ